jgi:hypothetical protein
MSTASPSEPEAAMALRTELDALRSAGAERFDPAGLELIQRLLDGARGLDGAARAHLLQRGSVRLEDLRTRTQAARADAEAALARLVESGVDAEGPLRDALEDGHWSRVHRAERIVRRRGARRRSAPPAQRVGYRQAAADFSSALGIASVEDSPPEQAGLLNATVLAARVLQAAESISPRYRQALVAELIDLGALLELPAPAPPRKQG